MLKVFLRSSAIAIVKREQPTCDFGTSAKSLSYNVVNMSMKLPNCVFYLNDRSLLKLSRLGFDEFLKAQQSGKEDWDTREKRTLIVLV